MSLNSGQLQPTEIILIELECQPSDPYLDGQYGGKRGQRNVKGIVVYVTSGKIEKGSHVIEKLALFRTQLAYGFYQSVRQNEMSTSDDDIPPSQ